MDSMVRGQGKGPFGNDQKLYCTVTRAATIAVHGICHDDRTEMVSSEQVTELLRTEAMRGSLLHTELPEHLPALVVDV